MNPVDNPRDLVRAAFLPLDCPREALRALLRREPELILENADGFEEYVQAALTHVSFEPRAAAGVEEIRELATFAATTPLRIRRADPLVGTKYETREPDGSAERRMLQRPLRKHPGLTWFERTARDYYAATLIGVFENNPPDPLQAEIAAVLLAPDPEDPTTPAAYQTYAGTDPDTVHQRYADRVTITETGDIRIDTDHLSRRCQLLPKPESQIGHKYPDRVSYLQFKGGGLVIPKQQFRYHLAEYAWYAWGKLVNTAYNTLTPRAVDKLVTATPNAEEDIYDRFRRNNTILTPYYGTTGTENPKRDWELRGNRSLANRPLQLEDKRLITVVDCIRANADLDFGDPTPLTTLFDRIKAFFPAPHRPGNDIGTKDTLHNALQAAADNRITLTRHPDTNDHLCTVPPPNPAPYHPVPETPPWDCYRQTLAKQTQTKPERQRRTDDGYHCHRINRCSRTTSPPPTRPRTTPTSHVPSKPQSPRREQSLHSTLSNLSSIPNHSPN